MKASLMLAVNPNAEREENDFYATDPFAINRSMSFFEEIGLERKIWEPACGLGHLSNRLKEFGYDVVSSDLIDRGGNVENFFVEDFLSDENGGKGDREIITNPPFKLAFEFVEKSMKILSTGKKAVFLLKIQFLETEKRAELFSANGLKYVGVFSNRLCCAKNGDFDKYFKQNEDTSYKGGTQLYAWFVFEKGFVGAPQIMFIK